MTITQIINVIIAGGLLGALGQGIRIVIGLKKFNDDNESRKLEGKPPEAFNASRLLISMFIGFVAGALGMIVKGSSLAKDGVYSTESIVMIIAIGYSGADFIEGLFKTYIDKTNGSKPGVNVNLPVQPDTLENLNFPGNTDINFIDHHDEKDISDQPPQSPPPNIK